MSLIVAWAVIGGVPVGILLDAVIRRLPQRLFPELRLAPRALADSQASVNPPASRPGMRHRALVSHAVQAAVVIVLAAAILAWTTYRFGVTWRAAYLAAWLCWLVVLAGIDMRHYVLPDVLTLGLLALAVAANATGIGTVGALNGICAAALGFTILWSLNAAYRLMRGCDGFGGGDIKMLAALGACVGVRGVADILTIASLLALAFAAARWPFAGSRVSLRASIPFGPFLAIAAALIVVWRVEQRADATLQAITRCAIALLQRDL